MARAKQDEQGDGTKAEKAIEKVADPFADYEDLSPELQYVLKGWHLDDAPPNAVLVIKGDITEMSFSWTIKCGDWLTAKTTYEPHNLKCDLLVYHPQAAIVAARGDLGIVAEVYRQLGNTTGREAKRIMLTYQGKHYPPPEEEPRVSAGEGRDTTSDQQTDDYE